MLQARGRAACPVVTRGITYVFGLSEPGGQNLGFAVRTPGFLCEFQAPSNSWVWGASKLGYIEAGVHRGQPGPWPGHSLTSCHLRPAQ